MSKVSDCLNKLTPEGAYVVLNKANQLEAMGKSIIHFEIGQPDFPTPKNIVDAGIDAIISGKTRYTSPLGIFELRNEIAKKHKVSVEQVAITPSGKTAIFVAMAALLNKGDHVHYPNPGFPTYRALIDYFDCVPQDKITNLTKLIILNSPSNPTGEVLGHNEMIAIKKHDTYVITDEMYSELSYGDYESYYGLSNKDKTILVNGFSKTYAMTGWRIGYMVFPKEMTEKIDCFLTHTVGCTATFTQYAALEALRGDQNSVKKMKFEFEKRRDYIVEFLNSIPGVTCKKPEGAFYAFPNISFFKKTSDEIAKHLLDEGVAVLPGTAFGDKGEGYIRISYATSMENIMEGLRRIKVALSIL